jgi:hypothetical protein
MRVGGPQVCNFTKPTTDQHFERLSVRRSFGDVSNGLPGAAGKVKGDLHRHYRQRGAPGDLARSKPIQETERLVIALTGIQGPTSFEQRYSAKREVTWTVEGADTTGVWK